MKFIFGLSKYGVVVLLVLIFKVQSDSLKQLHIAFRHGSRAPTDTFPNDPYLNYTWPGGWGQLTNQGKLQMYQLGQRMRTEYSYFIPKEYWPKDVNITSSYSDRCLMSAELFSAGMYPPDGVQIWNKELLWQPVPINYLPRSQDKTVVMKAACPKYDKIFKEIRATPAIMEIENKYQDLKDFLTKQTGMIVKNIEDIESISNTLEIEKLQNLSLPKWVNESMMETMKELGARNLALYSETEYMKRVKGGMFLKSMLESMEKSLNGTSDIKLYLYSAHDLSLVHFLRALDLISVIKPDYGAALNFELYSDGEVKIIYRNAWDAVPEIQVHPKCPAPCNISDFKKAIDNVLPVDYDKECAL